MSQGATNLFFLTFILFISTFEGGLGLHRFGYSRKHQHSWHHYSKSCSGSQQSPIHIVSHRATPLPLRALEMINYRNLLPKPLNLINNGHSVSLSVPKTKINEALPTIFGALLFENYEFESLHFHWGRRNHKGSEHLLNGLTYDDYDLDIHLNKNSTFSHDKFSKFKLHQIQLFPMEMHIIHRNIKYNNVSEALKYQNGLTVLAFFFQLQEKDNLQLDPLLSNFRFILKEGDSVHLQTTFTLASLLPQDMEIYYTYSGSLTTPPCSEAVTWLVFPESVPISFKQMKKFRRLSSDGSALVDNYRLVQPIGRRHVYVRKIWGRGDEQNVTEEHSHSWIGN